MAATDRPTLMEWLKDRPGRPIVVVAQPMAVAAGAGAGAGAGPARGGEGGRGPEGGLGARREEREVVDETGWCASKEGQGRVGEDRRAQSLHRREAG